MYVAKVRSTSNMLMLAQVYLNIVLDEALEERPGGEKVRIGMVVIRGNAVVMLEVLHSVHTCLSNSRLTPKPGTGPHQPRRPQDRTIEARQ